MKKTLLSIVAFLTLVLVFTSCYKQNLMYTPADKASGDQYVQLFYTENVYIVNKLNAAGQNADTTYDVEVRLLGAPAKSDLQIPFKISSDSIPKEYGVANSGQYTFSANYFTVKAGTDFGTVKLTLHNTKLPLDSTVAIRLTLDGSGSVKLADCATSAVIGLHKKNFCPWTKEDLVGSYDVSYSDFEGTTINGHIDITAGKGDTLIFDGLGHSLPPQQWGETVLKKSSIKVVVDGSDPINPNVYIPLTPDGKAQFDLETLDPNGTDVYDYYIFDLNTYTGSDKYPWVLAYCDKTLTANFVLGPDDFSQLWEGSHFFLTIDYGKKKIDIVEQPYINIPNLHLSKKR